MLCWNTFRIVSPFVVFAVSCGDVVSGSTVGAHNVVGQPSGKHLIFFAFNSVVRLLSKWSILHPRGVRLMYTKHMLGHASLFYASLSKWRVFYCCPINHINLWNFMILSTPFINEQYIWTRCFCCGYERKRSDLTRRKDGTDGRWVWGATSTK